MKEFPEVLPFGAVFERTGPEPDGSPEFFQMYDPTGPELGESPQ